MAYGVLEFCRHSPEAGVLVLESKLTVWFFFTFWTSCSLKLPMSKVNISKNKLLPALWNSKKAFKIEKKKIETLDVASDRQLVRHICLYEPNMVIVFSVSVY